MGCCPIVWAKPTPAINRAVKDKITFFISVVFKVYKKGMKIAVFFYLKKKPALTLNTLLRRIFGALLFPLGALLVKLNPYCAPRVSPCPNSKPAKILAPTSVGFRSELLSFPYLRV